MSAWVVSKNFFHLKQLFPELFELGVKAEKFFKKHPSSTLITLRTFGEKCAKRVADEENLDRPPKENQFDLLKRLNNKGLLSPDIRQCFHQLRMDGNEASHEDRGSHDSAIMALRNAHQIGIWFCQRTNPLFLPSPFFPPDIVGKKPTSEKKQVSTHNPKTVRKRVQEGVKRSKSKVVAGDPQSLPHIKVEQKAQKRKTRRKCFNGKDASELLLMQDQIKEQITINEPYTPQSVGHIGRVQHDISKASTLQPEVSQDFQSGLVPEKVDICKLKDGPAFTAIDFETADYGADSACALALVHVEGLEIVGRDLYLIRPPRSRFAFTHIHGITWAHVRGQPSFAELWPEIVQKLSRATFLAAHNAPFDRGVLAACCALAGTRPPPQEFLCTVRLARRAWRLTRANLPAVCKHLGIDLVHHDPASDAEACARIVIAARREGIALGPPLVAPKPKRS